ncbi:non-ribosomal peptide synthetase [Caldimonas brevitalea]|uniref:Non-ribosomal peptide synthetase module n=1 Tax=Caldimonas brevitalea TaxID=413882 RepID=A0A0G3BSD9_9BURK|nr:non-ribosomal peptide synthetase [Caldimonas brevitalea]AKJ29465.1 non-ribosomal peptide synthetase module [Caldimonas brevitalea]
MAPSLQSAPAARPPRRKADIVGIYPLTTAQQGLLFHSREQGESGDDPYFSVDLLELQGRLDPVAFEQAWRDVQARHAVLRSDFRWEEVSAPVQIVYRERPVTVTHLDWRADALDDTALATRLEAWCRERRVQGYDFRHAADLELVLVQLADNRWLLRWAYHHVALDGWSYALVLRDLLQSLQARSQGRAPQLAPARPFSDYIAWLKRQDVAAAEHFWRAELAGLEGPTPLRLPRPAETPAARWAELALPLPSAATLQAFMQRERVTLNTLCQGVWALLLSRYSGQRQVCFGVTVAGRPPELPGADEMAGVFINTLPLRVATPGGTRVGDWLRELQAHNAQLRQHEQLPLARLQALAGVSGQALFESLVVVENFPVDAALSDAQAELRAWPYAPPRAEGQPITTGGRNNYPLTLVFVPGAQPQLVVAYDRARLSEPAVATLARQLQGLLQRVLAQVDSTLDDLVVPVTGAAPVVVDEPPSAYVPLVAQVAQWARLQPEALAVQGEDASLSYAELEARATQLARRLAGAGVAPERCVAIAAPRSAAYGVAVLAVLKAGGHFLPLEPSQPVQRLRELLAASGARWLLSTDADLAARLTEGMAVRTLPAGLETDGATSTLPEADLPAPPPPGQSAYLIYTSGSTGTPKGAVLSHGGLAQYTAGLQQRLGLAPGARHAMVSTVSADLGHTTLFGALASGGSLHLLPAPLAFDPDGYAAWMREQAIDVLKIVPSHLAGLLAAAAPCLPRQTLVLGGEAAAPALLARLRQLAPTLRIVNHYGPTETTVGVLTFEAAPDTPAAELPLGRPLPGVRLRVLDHALQPVPPGVPGELYIGGASVARGYLGRADLTADRFVPDPEHPGQRLYRSGDRVCRTEDGLLHFLGRADEQVKIRGWRVEPNELASALRALPGVQDAAVVVREGRLLAYATPATLDVAALREALAQRLPDALCPAALLALPALPLTPNGKLDRRALPEPEAAPAKVAERPRSEAEQVLAEVWAAVLGRTDLGIHDNFFDLGGDSILNLQIIAGARRRGFKLTPKQVFEHPTIAQLAALARPVPGAGPATVPPPAHDAPLTPIQQWFFSLQQPEPAHWNQALRLDTPRRLDPARLEAALRCLVARHAALRLRFTRTAASGWRQAASPVEAAPLLERLDLAGLADDEAERRWLDAEQTLQRSFDLTGGPLLRAVHADLGPDRPQRLMLAAHHLAIDSVSWRLLVTELQDAYEQLAASATPALPPVPGDYLEWARRLSRLGATRHDEVAFWRGVFDGVATAPPSDTRNTYHAAACHQLELPAAALLQASAAQRCSVEELLLAALAPALCQWQRSSAVVIELEGHGREPVFDDLDTSQTVGWFTCRYPVRLAPGGEHPLAEVKRQLRQVPGKGLGWGLLRYPGDGSASPLADLPSPWICFNYLGRIDAGQGGAWLQLADTQPSTTRSPRNQRSHWLDIDADLYGGRLRLAFTWCPALHSAAEIEALAAEVEGRLMAAGRQPNITSAADFPLARLPAAQLQTVLARWPDALDLYPLAPLQAGLLFHSLGDRGQGLYLNQLHCRFGRRLQTAKLRQAWDDTIAAHDILRTVFVWDGLQEPHQVVLPRASMPWREVESDDEPDLPAFLQQDLATGFALDQAPLMRVTLIHTGAGSHMVWTRHHLLLDGWSSARLLGEVFERYAALCDGTSKTWPAAPAYREHIAWLARQDAAAGEQYWRRQLADLERPTLLQSVAGKAPATGAATGMARKGHTLASSTSDALAAVARRHRVTLNTLIQAAWAAVLAGHCATRDVVFGITVAGRPHELPDAQRTLGLFINTVPLRVRLPAAMSLHRWWQGLQADNLALREHEQSQLADVQRLCGLAPQTPLFDTLLVFENYPVDAATSQGLAARWGLQAVQAQETLSLPLTLTVYPGEPLRFEFVWREDCFDAHVVAALADQFSEVLAAFTRDAEAPLGSVCLLPPSEREAYLNQVAEACLAHPVHDTLAARFERQARATPDAVALCYGNARLSYDQLNRQANRLAHALVALGVGPERKVALCLPRSHELVVAILAVLKAGGAYVPLDTAAPAGRQGQVLEDSGAGWLLHTGRGELPALPPAVRAHDIRTLTADQPDHDLPPRVQPQQLAYVIYTSGSTGRPKGVAVTQANVLRLFDVTCSGFDFGADDVWTLFHSCAFDFSVWELWGALLHGGRLVLVPLEVARDSAALATLLQREAVTVLNQTPSAFYRLSETLCAASPPPPLALRLVIFGGEALDPARLAPWFARFGDQRPQLVNMYGITETTVHVTRRTLSSADAGAGSVIGRPLDDLRLYLLDDNLAPVPPGVAGELYVGGAGLARGYLGRGDLTAGRFVPDPHGREPGGRLYRSGDLARRRADGEIEYLGRADQQVKIRGFRIELGDIEATLLRHPGVRDAAVLAQRDGQGGATLLAWVVGDAGLDPDTLRAFARDHLPDYMVPARCTPVPALPLTVNGKLDRKALLADAAEPAAKRATPPRNDLERRLAAVWAELLQLEEVSVDDDFFSLGGHSLLATSAVARMRAATGLPLGIADLYQRPTVAQLAEHLAAAAPAPSDNDPLAAMTELLDALEQETP